MQVPYMLAAIYLSVGFAKFVLDISQLHIFVRLIKEFEIALGEHARPMSPATRGAVAAGSLLLQCLLAWPAILRAVGLLEFLQPVKEERMRNCLAMQLDVETDQSR